MTGVSVANEIADAPDAASKATIEQAAEPIATVDFTRDIQPLLASRCYACHGPDQAESGLRLTDAEGAYIETDSGEHAIVPGDPDAGTLISRILSEDEFERMPPEGEPLDAEQVEMLRRWIADGAKFEKHWAFKPISDPEVPSVPLRASSMKGPIDAFVAARRRQAGLPSVGAADRATWIRRVTYGLTGLPPTPQQIADYVHDTHPAAKHRVVDRLLASPRHGEHWARHWLDVVRYAESNSFERDGTKPNAWKYRDWVAAAFNEDLPYDRFVEMQLAGDELPDVTPESLTATGYWRLGIWDDEPADPLQAKFDGYDDLVTTPGQAFLGLTINCARCHDHKIDPIPQKDYYSMVAFVADVTPYASRGDLTTNNQVDIAAPEILRQRKELQRQRDHLKRSIVDIEQQAILEMSAPDQRATEGPDKERRRVLREKMRPLVDAETWTRYEGLKSQLRQAEEELQRIKADHTVLGLAKTIREPEPTPVLARGNPHSPGHPVPPAFPSIFAAAKPQIPAAADERPTAGRRRVLANWMTDADNFLVPRVAVNRLWQFHFGRGIVRSPNNFGRMGSPPTHPDLLDHLAGRFRDDGWSIKRMHRRMVLSQTYAMTSSMPEPLSPAFTRAVESDPENDFYWRFDVRRLSAEEIRDSILVVSGQMNHRVGGPSVYPTLSAEVMAGQSRPGSGWGYSEPADQTRRSLYTHVKRSLITPMMEAFDFPDPDQTCEARFQTLGANQSLQLLNADWTHDQAAALRDAVLSERSTPAVDEPESAMAAKTDSEYVADVLARVLGREASEEERRAGRLLMDELRRHGLSVDRSRQLYALSVLNWNEFLFVD